MQPREELILKAATLARSAPNEWREFVEALGKYNEVTRENLVKSPLNELPVNQGRALMSASILGIFVECLKSADKINRNAK